MTSKDSGDTVDKRKSAENGLAQTVVESYDAIVLGSGEAGKYIAWNLASNGKKTALVERRYIGGSCPNIACLPTKNFVHSAKVVHTATQLESYGMHKADSAIDITAIRGRKRAMVDGLVAMHQERFAKSGAELILGEGKFVGSKFMEVGLADGGIRLLTAETIVLSTGSRSLIDSIPGLVEAAPLTHVEALELDEVPGHLLILGGGYIGLEFAQVMRRFGSQVTLIERNERFLHKEDSDVSELLLKVFTVEGIEIVTGAKLKEVSGMSGEKITLNLEQDGEPITLKGTHLMVATGRTPNTSDIGLDVTGVDLTPEGFVRVNEHLETTASGIFAAGDCAGSPHFTHIAYDDFRVLRDRFAGFSRSTTGRLVPSCLFVDPEFARIGLSETEAKEKNISYRLVKLAMKSVLRTRTTGETEGFLKALISASDDTIIGFTACGASSGEMMAPVQLAMSAKLPYTVLRDSTFAHPTFAEGLVYLFSQTPTLMSYSNSKV
ncbi:NAD(P)/FAD-dependent oxidoreductase [Granulicella sp. L60]|uniref:dihydrolipoyl dehydrogenase family protein n=1 Tax=Granulicella sp. L60 TaxID=1641866 RepID=UPI00131C589A|nr:FAD-dependent oxidoreductase [Granulicella sp. L60]